MTQHCSPSLLCIARLFCLLRASSHLDTSSVKFQHQVDSSLANKESGRTWSSVSMVKEIKGPWGVILVGPGAVNTPYKPWDRNQGTYLAIALAVPLLLTLLSTLSVPIIPGAYTVKVTPYNKLGEVVYGTWSIGVKGDSIKDIVT